MAPLFSPENDSGGPPSEGCGPIGVNSDDNTLIDVPTGGDELSRTRPSDMEAGDFSGSLRDRYRLIRLLGKGGFGIVYLANDRVLEQDVAIKVLKFGLSSDNDRQRFIFEARTGAKLRHPAIVNVFDILQTEEGLQLVMEYYPGGTLSQLIKREGALPLRQALDYTRQVATGLSYAHKKQIIHRDIKPANIFFAGDDHVKLGDFGICAHYESHDHTSTGEIMGTPLYMAPEQTIDSKDVDPRSDLFSLGMTLYHMVTGTPPRVLDLDQLEPDIRALIKKLTAYERRDRPVSAEQLMVSIDRILAERHAQRGAAVTPSSGRAATTAASAEITPVTATPSTPTTADSTHTYSGPEDVTVTQTPHPAAAQHRSLGWSAVAFAAVLVAGALGAIYMFGIGKKAPPDDEKIVAQAAGEGKIKPTPETAPAPISPAQTEPTQKKEDSSPVNARPSAPPEVAAAKPADPPADKPEPTPAAETAPPPANPLPVTQPAEARREMPTPAPTPQPSFEEIQTSLAEKLKPNEAAGISKRALATFLDWLSSTPQSMFVQPAILSLQEAAKSDPTEPLYPYLLSRIYQKSGNADEERTAREQYEKLDPGYAKKVTVAMLREKFDAKGVEKLNGTKTQALLKFLPSGTPIPVQPH